jgi:hypothetical protein
MIKLRVTTVGLAVWSLLGPSFAQDAGRPQDGFYSGQSNGQVGGQSNGQITGRVDGRANRNEGIQPSAGDTSKQIAPVDRGAVNDAESMDAVVRPGLQR